VVSHLVHGREVSEACVHYNLYHSKLQSDTTRTRPIVLIYVYISLAPSKVDLEIIRVYPSCAVVPDKERMNLHATRRWLFRYKKGIAYGRVLVVTT
jgi:hypothetical protein